MDYWHYEFMRKTGYFSQEDDNTHAQTIKQHTYCHHTYPIYSLPCNPDSCCHLNNSNHPIFFALRAIFYSVFLNILQYGVLGPWDKIVLLLFLRSWREFHTNTLHQLLIRDPLWWPDRPRAAPNCVWEREAAWSSVLLGGVSYSPV